MKKVSFAIVVFSLLSIPCAQTFALGEWYDPLHIEVVQTQEQKNQSQARYLQQQYGNDAYLSCRSKVSDCSTTYGDPNRENRCLLSLEGCLSKGASDPQGRSKCSANQTYYPSASGFVPGICKCNQGYSMQNGSCVASNTDSVGYFDSTMLNNVVKKQQDAKVRYHDTCEESYGIGSKWTEVISGDGLINCECKPGYLWDMAKTSCVTANVVSQTDNNATCVADYGKGSVWSGSLNDSGGPICDCANGYAWNPGVTACQRVVQASSLQECEKNYVRDVYGLCVTIQGLRNRCVSKYGQNADVGLPDYNICGCKEGFTLNSDSTNCIPVSSSQPTKK